MGIIIKILIILSVISAIMLYLIILGANKCKSEEEKIMEDEEEMNFFKSKR